MWSRFLQRLDERFPGLSDRLADRLPRDLPAFGVSLAVHFALVLVLAFMGISAQAELKSEINSQLIDNSIPVFDNVEIQDIDQPDQPAVANSIGSSAPNFSVVAHEGSAPPAVASRSDGQGPMMMLSPGNISRPGEIVTPSARTIAESVSIKGSGAEHVGGVEGAVDRVAMELLNRLERGKTLVIWAFDASASLAVEREKLSKHIEQVYAHINELDKDKVATGDALMTMVVGFGEHRKAMLPEPTNDSAAIIKAIREIPLDPSGVESTFQTVTNIAKTWGSNKFKDANGQSYQAIVIVVTDEVGDDDAQLETAISTALAAKVPIYVLGSPAPFGKRMGRMTYTNPKTKHVTSGEVRLGPESVSLETIHLPFWYSGDQYDNLDAGFGPYALSRMATVTGGIYFITRMGPSRLTFDPNAMREYRPDWVSVEQYEKNRQKDPIREAVMLAAQITQQKLPGQPGLTFPPADSPDFKEAMARNQDTIARLEYTINEALVPISAVSKFRDREPSRRWMAHYDLIRGRLQAMKIRCAEYQTACARMKKDAPKFKDAKSNAWRLVATEEILTSERVATVAKDTKALLKRVVDDHPNTPWALLAQRELKDPLGFKWVETFVPPQPKPTETEAAEAKKKKAEVKKEMPKEPEIKL